ncbi:MAG: hypothetical protein Q7U34_13105 [Anaerolineales bacterium]|nr:hypothetical protein [Anaerolineales bacterium]
MANFKYIRAEDLDHAWLNFELDVPLDPLPDGRLNPFYVNRPGNPIAQLEDGLLGRYYSPPKLFFSGHRGCGKSTELRRLAVKPEILAKYYPIHFTIRNEADINNLDFKDVLLAIGGRMYRDYKARGGKLPAQLEKELDNWRGKLMEEVTRADRLAGFEVDGGLDAFFATAGLKMKLEPATRHVMRQVIERDVTGLIRVIDDIVAAILAREKRMPLVLIDDLDKPDLNIAREIFYGHRETMLQPNCAIVYTVSSPLFYSGEMVAIRQRATPVFLPNIKLHAQGKKQKDREGYETMREFVCRRMNPDLILPKALDEAVRIGGGVFSEMARVMRSAIQRARRHGRIVIENVRGAEVEIRGEYRRILTAEQRALMKTIHATNRLDEPDKVAPLLQFLAVLEYANGDTWCDVHPALVSLLEEDEKAGEERA